MLTYSFDRLEQITSRIRLHDISPASGIQSFSHHLGGVVLRYE